jgi:hypothetical protein
MICATRGIALLMAFVVFWTYTSLDFLAIRGAVIYVAYMVVCVLIFGGSFMKNRTGHVFLVLVPIVVFVVPSIAIDTIVFSKSNTLLTLGAFVLVQVAVPSALSYSLAKDPGISRSYKK